MLDCAIIGAGPAGLTAGLYAGRYRMQTVILERITPGGQILLSADIHNFPGFPGGIETGQLISRIKKQVDDAGTMIQEGDVLSITAASEHGWPFFKLRCSGRRDDIEAKSVIIASGARWKHLGVNGEEKLIGRGVSYCATCDGPLFRNKDVLVVGGGDRALEDALYLTAYATSVRIVHRRQAFRGAEILQEKVRNNPRITFLLDSVVEEIIGSDKVEAARVRNLKTGKVSIEECQGIFIFIGITPATDFAKDIVKTDEAGFILTDDSMQSSQNGVYAAGDCRRKSLYQVINACGDGAVAAHSAHAYLITKA